MSNVKKIRFHHLHPDGFIARKRANNRIIGELIADGILSDDVSRSKEFSRPYWMTMIFDRIQDYRVKNADMQLIENQATEHLEAQERLIKSVTSQ